jgi:hypothetical protein
VQCLVPCGAVQAIKQMQGSLVQSQLSVLYLAPPSAALLLVRCVCVRACADAIPYFQIPRNPHFFCCLSPPRHRQALLFDWAAFFDDSSGPSGIALDITNAHALASNPFTCWRALSVTNASQVAAARSCSASSARDSCAGRGGSCQIQGEDRKGTRVGKRGRE